MKPKLSDQRGGGQNFLFSRWRDKKVQDESYFKIGFNLGFSLKGQEAFVIKRREHNHVGASLHVYKKAPSVHGTGTRAEVQQSQCRIHRLSHMAADDPSTSGINDPMFAAGRGGQASGRVECTNHLVLKYQKKREFVNTKRYRL